MIKEYIKKRIALTLIILMLVGCTDNVTQIYYEEEQTKEVNKTTITLTYAGDCTLGTDAAFGGITLPVEVQNQGGDYGYFLRNVQKYFANDDLTIVNFEGTLTDRGIREEKTFAFRGKPEYTGILTEGSVEAVTLANNHSRDYGEVSMTDTKEYLDKAGIVWFENLNTKVIDVKGVKVGLVGLYSLNGSAEGNLPKAMGKLKADGAELIVVEVHWGIEGENYPQVSQVELAHSAIDMGANVVIGHHPHVLQGIEIYKESLIAYSMGNFCFGGNQNPRDKDSMIISQSFDFADGKIKGSSYEIVPCSISSVSSRNNYQPTIAEGSERDRIANKIRKFSAGLNSAEFKLEGKLKSGIKSPNDDNMIL